MGQACGLNMRNKYCIYNIDRKISWEKSTWKTEKERGG
jgi:hypothetical protein